jgi:thermitase
MEGSIRHIGITILARGRMVATLAVMTLLVALGSLGFVVTDRAHAQGTDPGDDFVDGEVVVKLNKASGTTIGDVYGAYSEIDRTRTDTFLASSGIYLLRLNAGSDTAGVVGEMRNDTARFVYAEFNYTTDAPEDSRMKRFHSDSEPTPDPDPEPYKRQYAVGALKLPEAHNVNKGAGATVAILDTGAQLDHPELAGSFVEEQYDYDFIGDDGDPSEERNGLDDNGDCPTTPCTDSSYIDEATGHGTHVAGIVHLTAPDAKIMPLRVLDSDGRGNIFVIAEAIQHAVDPDKNPRSNDGVDVINMSLGSSRESNLIRDVADDLDAVDDDDDDDTGPALQGVPVGGVTVVGSAGNNAAERPAYPAAETGVIGVTAVDREERKSGFSNYFGSPQVDISAPGDDIYSTFTGGRYAEWDGTSMAAPFVAGQAALIRSMRPGLPSTGQQGQPSVSEFITTTARSIDAANDNTAWKGKLGAGHADVYASLVKANTTSTISSMRPIPGSRTKDRTPLISATVRDAQTNLTKSNLQLYVDGRRIGVFSYDTSTDRLARTTGRLSYGYHRVRITATDPFGSVTRTWGFRVVR